MLPGAYRLGAAEEGPIPARTPAKLLAADLTGVDLVVPAPTRVQGRVVTASGQPVEDARVSGSFETSTGGGGMMSLGEATVTGADGRFELKRSMPGTMRITARHEQLGSAQLGPEPLKAGEARTLELRLQPGASISGVVRTDDGKPAAAVRITSLVRDMRMGLDAVDVSGPDGRYRLSGLPAARVTVVAQRSGQLNLGPEDQPHQKTVTLADGEQRTGVDLVVSPAGLAIKGVILDPAGKPVAGAIISAAPERDGRAFRGMSRDLKAYSDVEGNFSLTDVARGVYTVWAIHPEHPEAEARGVSPGQGVLRLQFPSSASVAGVVVLPDGKPVPHYTISVLPGPAAGEKPEDRRRRQMGSFDVPVERVQDPGGAFTLERLAGASYELMVTAADGASGSQVVAVQAGEKKAGVRIQVVPGLRIRGRVVEHGTNRPMPGAGVLAMGPGTARAHTDSAADGSFVLEGAPAGEVVRLNVSAADRDRHVTEFKELEVKPGQTLVEAGTIKLLPGNQRERSEMPASERGTLGMAYKREGDRVLLRAVAPERPAAQAGLQGGDTLLAIDGKDVSDLGNGAIGYLLMGKAGSTVTVTVAPPGGAPRTVSLTRAAAPPPGPPGSGPAARN
jgi:hypothetical protein